MIPSVLATQFREGLADYVETTFPITSPIFDGSVRRFLDKEDAFFHEPFISVKLPFRVAAHGNERFEAIHSNYAPYVHQNKAFDRLNGDDPRSTLVATGTGSGKTECFTYPLLEYCYKHMGERGIKALIIYPMNALASDQAERIAKLVWNSPELNHNMTVGMYVGGETKNACKVMDETHVITDHETLLNNPPDILLTNYKMLDYLMIHPRYSEIWKDNIDPDTLHFVVVDELHTFDGAQGTDLACLIRRLKSRLKIQPGYLCCVGTSATMGGPESTGALLKYAQEIFGEPFEEDAVITEDRLSSREFFDGQTVEYFRVPSDEEAMKLKDWAEKEEEESYLQAAVNAWFEEENRIDDVLSDEGRVELARKLMHHSFFQSLMSVMDAKTVQSVYLCDELSNIYPNVHGEVGKSILDSMLALVSHARGRDVMGKLTPFLFVQLQLWMRELNRVMAKVDAEQSDLMLEADLNRTKARRREHYLPVVNCRDCGATGWAGTLDERSQLSIHDMKAFYNQFFAYDKRIRMVFPRRKEDANIQMHMKFRFCPKCLYVQNEQNGEDKCGSCGQDTIPVWMPNLDVSKKSSSYVCPFCGGTHSLILVGVRSATAISAGISQLYGSTFNDDKKLLAFNDNVQDAAHKASFFNARTWRFGLRTAMQHFVCDGGEGKSISKFGDDLSEYWIGKMSEEEYVDTFIPHNMAGDRTYEALQKTGRFPDEAGRRGLISDLKKRIAYEALLEYGISSRIGRTLEKSGASMIAPDTELIRSVCKTALIRIQNEAGVRELTEEQLMGYLLLMANHMRLNGAFAMPVYTGYVETGAKSYMLTKKHIKWMNAGFYQPLFPAAQSMGKSSEDFEELSDHCWYVRKLSQLIGKTAIECPGIIDAVGVLLNEMEKQNLIKRMEGPRGLPVYGLNPEVYFVTQDIGVMRCSACGYMISTKGDQAAHWDHVPCTREGCNGYYAPFNHERDYYAHIYENGELVRVHASEHTGLLTRDDRETLEANFKHKKQEHKAWDPNLLSCTPTLEMGIDIGDLSTVVLCSVPPSQPQYLQRIGRAGRKDGNSLAVSVASSKPHDLYFYQDPIEMIGGKVDPPGVFLNASAVLERQFVAFCLDNWVKTGIGEAAIPATVKNILSKINLPSEPVDAFPFNFLSYIGANLSRLSRMFEQMFDRDSLSDESRERIRGFAKGTGEEKETLRYRILHVFKELYDQRESLRKDIKKLKKTIDDLDAKPKDASYDLQKSDLVWERAGLVKVERDMEDKNTFNFLSDEGMLPNYAFPEAGVILKAILTRKVELDEKEESDAGYEPISYEYNRSASSAISEFAPDNSFYAGGHKLKIDRVDVSSTEPEQWRLCPDCNHAAPLSTLHNVVSCPRCGSLKWADQGQVRSMLKVRTVFSTNKYEESRTGDESDDRTRKFYSREMLVDIDESKDITSGYQTTKGELPFGYEFVSKATLREINFGESDNVGTKLSVAGKEEVRNGFRICKYCGKIQPRGEKSKPVHTPFCRANAQNFKDPFEECMFLYREFTSEAIRILIPSTSLDTTSEKMESFAAAIMLGLKKKFNNVDHLGFCVMDAPVPEANYRKQYMVIYDSVPGGTGYLKELMTTPDALMHVFELALQAMQTCTCVNDLDKDGCYHCLYAYRQSNKINTISRRTAVELLEKILSGKDSLEPIKSISAISVNTLFDSELEKRFIEAIEQSSSARCKVEINKEQVKGKEGYFLQIGSCCWDIELQSPFTGEQGVKIPSKADFVFWPKTTGNKQRPVVVFTDGFLYHKDIVDVDSNKRMAIRRACNYPVWSLTWKDVDNQLKKHPDENTNKTLDAAAMPFGKYYEQSVQRRNLPGWSIKDMSAFDLLVQYLATPDADEVFAGYAQSLALAMIDQTLSTSESGFNRWNAGYSAMHEILGLPKAEFKKTLVGIWQPVDGVNIFSELSAKAVSGVKTREGKVVPVYDETACSVLLQFDDSRESKDNKFENAWSQFLLASNLLQFVSPSLIVTQKGIDAEIYNWAYPSNSNSSSSAGNVDEQNDESWEYLIKNELFDTNSISLARKLQAAGCVTPSIVGYELDGEPVAEMVWENQRVAVQIPGQEAYRDQLMADGWNVYPYDSEELVSLLKEA